MRYLAATLHTIGFRLSDRASTKFQDDPERGSVTIENVLWAVAFIAIVGVVAGAISTYVTTKSGQIK